MFDLDYLSSPKLYARGGDITHFRFFFNEDVLLMFFSVVCWHNTDEKYSQYLEVLGGETK